MTTLSTSKTSLSLAAEALAYEIKTNPANEGRISDMLSAMLGTADRVFGAIQDIFTKQSTGLAFASNDTYRKITAANYFDFAQKEIETAPGFTGNLLEYGAHVESTLGYYKTLDEALRFYTQLMGKIINSKAERESWVDVTHRFTQSEKQREQYATDTRPFWTGSKDKSLVKIEKLTRRMTDLHLLDHQAQNVASILKGFKLQELVNRISQVNDLASAVAEDVKAGKYEGISTVQVNNLSAGVLELANQAELFSAIVYSAQTFMGMVERLQAASTQVV